MYSIQSAIERFNNKFNHILNNISTLNFDILFMGYTMNKNNRESTKNIYNNNSDNILINKINNWLVFS